MLLIPAALVAAGTLIPLAYLAERALTRGWPFVIDELIQPRTAALVGRSLLLVVVVTAACVVLGVGLAVLLTRTDVKARRALAVALTLPLAMPELPAGLPVDVGIPWSPGSGAPAGRLTVVSYPAGAATGDGGAGRGWTPPRRRWPGRWVRRTRRAVRG